MRKKLLTFPDIDDHRINVIRTRLDEDVYVVNTRQIADKIIDIELALTRLGRRPSSGYIS
jgi:anti-sigma28 factor (negative regulator of flagellin synthesis)